MPVVFDFKCQECGKMFESSEKKPLCAHCNSPHVYKKFTVAGVRYNGPGFYSTDSRDTFDDEEV